MCRIVTSVEWPDWPELGPEPEPEPEPEPVLVLELELVLVLELALAPVALPHASSASLAHRSRAPHCPADVRKKRRRPSPRPTWHTCMSTHEREIVHLSQRESISIGEE